MAMIDNEIIENIRKSVDIVDIIGSYIPLTQRGKNYFGVCPFHDDHSPSMSVSPDLQIFRCFSCGATGNVIKFVTDYENVSFKEALAILANKAGLSYDFSGFRTNQKIKSSPLYELYEISRKFYQNNINTANSKQALEYLKKRDIDEEIIKKFEIGLSLKKRDLLTKLLISKGYSSAVLESSGLVLKNQYGYSDIYCDRIMFPLWDLEGRTVGFSGRIYAGNDPSKYINTRETEIFQKRRLVYNYHNAKDECRHKDTVIIMEGFLDVIRAYSVGIKNVVATMGTAVTKEQVAIIKKMAKNVILCFDGDAAGEHATIACSEELQKVGIVPKVIVLEDGLDPDDYIRKYGKERFIAKIENPISIIDFKLQYYKKGKDLTSNVNMANYVKQIIAELSKIDDDILRELTLKKLSVEANLDVNFIREKLNSLNDKKSKEPKVLKTENKVFTKYEIAQRNILYYMLSYEEVIRLANKKILFMPTDKYRSLANEIKFYYNDYGKFTIADFMTYIMNNPNYELLQNVMEEILKLNLKEKYLPGEIEDYINTINEYSINLEMENIKRKIMETDDIKIKAQLAQELVNLKLRGNSND